MRNGLILVGVCLCLAFGICAAAESQENLLGDKSDGSRAVSVHNINLLGDDGQKIGAQDQPAMPFSTRQTCGKCHSYDLIARGWHFNAADPNAERIKGRVGQPWIYIDPSTGTQIPVSYRSWPGVFSPNDVGLTPWQFTQAFGRHTPGGGAGEMNSDKPEEIVRQLISGKLEINCLTCHSAAHGQNQAEYAVQVVRQNMRWAATGACGFASVTGAASSQPDTFDPMMSDAISVKYKQGVFDEKNLVLFDIVRKAPAQRCYFCHSNKDILADRPEQWAADEDVHLAAGLTCVDCHRNGTEHNITRGYQDEAAVSDNPLSAVSSCKGCHLGTASAAKPAQGRLGAPKPKHAGIPPIHFDKLTCTACHSGLWPADKTYLTKTARAHRLGMLGVDKSDDVVPHIYTPVFAKGADGKIGPHKLFWPAFWGSQQGEQVKPLNLAVVKELVGPVTAGETTALSSIWAQISQEKIIQVLNLLKSRNVTQGRPVYVAGGKLYRLSDSGSLKNEEHPAGKAYLWPIAHDVRPAMQSLGVRACRDCHTTDSAFFFGKVAVDTPVVGRQDSTKSMIEFEKLDPVYTKAFAFSFVFRPWLKFVTLLSSAGIAAVLAFYGLGAIGCVLKTLAEQKKSDE